ncbi:hypothetical protein D2M30_2778 [Bacillus amyloliquefaciens]|nr:hypothetical protein D2M30_2778 [Bacillus amyloliquefaciens]
MLDFQKKDVTKAVNDLSLKKEGFSLLFQKKIAFGKMNDIHLANGPIQFLSVKLKVYS